MLDLQPLAYAITATKDGDAASSNWAGKTSLLEAVDFALTGRRPRDAVRKVDWITRGEPKGEVDLTLSDGSRVVRSMSTTGSEKLWYYPPGDPKNAAYQESAQQAIDALLGLSAADAPTWSFRQGEMAQLLRMDPGERLRMFSGWLGLEKLDDCAAMAAGARGEVEKRRAAKQRDRDAANSATETALGRVGVTAETIRPSIADAEREVARLTAVVAEERAKGEGAAERARLTADAARYDALVREGVALAEARKKSAPREVFDAELVRLTADLERAVAEETVVTAEWRALASAASGEFDGRCPIAGAPCPSAAFVTETTVRDRARRQGLSERLRGARTATAALRDDVGRARVGVDASRSAESRIETLRAAVRPLKAIRDRWQALEGSAASDSLPEATAALDAAQGRLGALRATLGLCEASAAKAVELAFELKGLEKVAAIPTAAAAVFEAARKRIAEGVLAEIEAHANDVLGRIGADLSVAFRWGREGAGLADACGKCGAAFPASRKVRDCSRCGAERGQKITERLDLLPSRRSGAADDLASIGATLGTSRWLRADRGSGWGVALLDEPVGQMDAANRRAFAAKLPEILRSSGFAQSMVVAHHPDALGVLPGRIIVESRGGYSTARVL